MPRPPAIRILESDSNKRGDLFGRLVADLFFALGYETPKLNIHKTGREIDAKAEHRFEQRRMVAECKATSSPIGGADTNKLRGVRSLEKHSHGGIETIGYFVSLSGFTGSAEEQEREAGAERIILLDGNTVVDELVNGRVMVTREEAMARAGQFAPKDTRILKNPDLLAHDLGWIWCIYFGHNKERTHFALIHPDGDGLSRSLADEVIEADKSVGGALHSLSYISPSAPASVPESEIQAAKERYLAYVAAECGAIQLEGLPADQDVGSRQFALEQLFVPLYLSQRESECDRSTLQRPQEWLNDAFRAASIPDPADQIEWDTEADPDEGRMPVGRVLEENARIAILAAPGGGKSTLLKRLAMAYAFPDKRNVVNDDLPIRDWLPLFVRCRQLQQLVRRPIMEILGSIAERAEMADLSDAFGELVRRALRGGEALLLVDGLDEIPSDQDRAEFILQMRTFLAMYPTANIVVTSREAGFRSVAGVLSSQCAHYRLADFDNDDIERLVVAWHKSVIGDRPDVISDAQELTKVICGTDRVRRLACNPLLLTTLLLVKRWVGQLPTKRSVLYDKAIEVLLMTWNQAAHEALDQSEVIPQLAFLAFTMMKEGMQRVSRSRLKAVLSLAREQMPDTLGYAEISVNDFVEKVELRSSLLMLSGHEIQNGILEPMYEFQHLTFQEYLAAKAVAAGYYPDREDTDTLVSVLEPYLDEESWKEVIPLAAVLSARQANPLIKLVIERCKALPSELIDREERLVQLLAQCVLVEPSVPPTVIDEALEWIARRTRFSKWIISQLRRSKYAAAFRSVVSNAYMSFDSDISNLGGALGLITLQDLLCESDVAVKLEEQLAHLLESEDPAKMAAAALAGMIAVYTSGTDCPSGTLDQIGDSLMPLLTSDNPALQHAACWAATRLAQQKAWKPARSGEVLAVLLDLWLGPGPEAVQSKAAWALREMPHIIPREVGDLPPLSADRLSALTEIASTGELQSRNTAPVVGYYWRTPWTDAELAELMIKDILPWRGELVSVMLESLGKAGRTALDKLEKQRAGSAEG